MKFELNCSFSRQKNHSALYSYLKADITENKALDNRVGIMKTTVKYIVLKSREYQLGTSLFEETINADKDYFDAIPAVIRYQNRDFKVNSKELSRKQIVDELEESQSIVVKVIALP